MEISVKRKIGVKKMSTAAGHVTANPGGGGWGVWGSTTTIVNPPVYVNPALNRAFVPQDTPGVRKFGQTPVDPPWTNILFKETFPLCCGIHIITRFGTDSGKKEDVEKSIKEHDRDAAVGLHLISLNPTQKAAFGKVVEKCGYEVLKTFRNPIHNHNLTLYGKDVNH